MFLWSYIYQATVGGQLITTLLAICQADVVTMSDDKLTLAGGCHISIAGWGLDRGSFHIEYQLRALEQQLARARRPRRPARVRRGDWQPASGHRSVDSPVARQDRRSDVRV
jgi:hypothetical protein